MSVACRLLTLLILSLFALETSRAKDSIIRVDLDGDGKVDLLESGAKNGKSLVWKVSLWRNDQLKEIGTFDAHPDAISFEPDQGRIYKDINRRAYTRIWVYLAGGGRTGQLGYYVVRENSIDELNSIEIYPGDGGTKLGNALYDSTFKKSPIPFKMSVRQKTE